MLHVLCGAFLFVTVYTESRGAGIQRSDSKDCPFPCTQGGVHYCYPLPCPLPPCSNPVTTPGECCPHCPSITDGHDVANKTCLHPCEVNGHHFCFPPPCPLPPCANPVTRPGQCCQTCPEGNSVAVGKREDSDCVHPCTQGGVKYCQPIPCPFPPCDNPVTTPGECCPHCPTDGHDVANKTCPHPCEVNGNHFCFPPPCPPPPCANPVTLPSQCCQTCPEDNMEKDQHPVQRSPEWPDPWRCYPPPPCPPPPPPPYCNVSVIQPYDLCCEVCETACPNRCKWLDDIWCNPPACPPVLCPNATLTEGDCCPHCEADTDHQ
ncbi:kielin/chordin-like protein [Ylistrum balloti]|uniref:kielin/chordin-like protein n=1 Tax=Ylistrum balloti TaxID=509963 RepID=UPI002905A26C|nr:kielin/chordin-like protein [Ylistrum balloti]